MREQKLKHAMKKLAPLRLKNDFTYEIQLKLHERTDKKQI